MGRFNRVIVLLLSCLVLFAAACTEDDGVTETTSEEEQTDTSNGDQVTGESVGKKSIGIVNVFLAAEIMVRQEEGLTNAFDALGWEYQSVDIQGVPDKLSPTVNSFVEQGVDAIVLLSADPRWGGEAVAAATDAGVPVIQVLTGAPPTEGIVATIGPTGYAEANVITEYMINTLRAETDDPEVLVFTQPIVPQTHQRDTLTLAMLEDAGIRVLDEHALDIANQVGDAERTTRAWLDQYPDADAIWASTVEAVKGAAPAFEAAGSSIPIYTFYDDSPVVQAMHDGHVAAVATIDVEHMEWKAADALYRIFSGSPPAPETYLIDPVTPVLVTAEDAPEPGVYFKTDVDYKTAFRQQWGVE